MSKIVIFGATSAIAQSIARSYATSENDFILVARNHSHLKDVENDIKTRGAGSVETLIFDLNHLDQHPQIWRLIKEKMILPQIIIVAHGILESNNMEEILKTNFLSVVSLLEHSTETIGHGSTVAIISSVAGDRIRQSNYIYGCSKLALSFYLNDLRKRLIKKGAKVLEVKPGYVDTPMTKSFKKNFLWATPEKVANDIVKAIKRNQNVIYTPGYWKWIMLVVRLIPNYFFK